MIWPTCAFSHYKDKFHTVIRYWSLSAENWGFRRVMWCVFSLLFFLSVVRCFYVLHAVCDHSLEKCWKEKRCIWILEDNSHVESDTLVLNYPLNCFCKLLKRWITQTASRSGYNAQLTLILWIHFFFYEFSEKTRGGFYIFKLAHDPNDVWIMIQFPLLKFWYKIFTINCSRSLPISSNPTPIFSECLRRFIFSYWSEFY